MRKSKFRKMFAVMTFFITVAVVSILNVSQAKAASSSSITVTSPNGGEIWKVGETHRITWASVGVEKVTMYLYDNRISSSGAIVNYPVPDNQSISASQGYYDWTILSNVLQANDGKNFQIIVQDASNYLLSGKSSAPFRIVATSTPSVTVISPNGGEKWEAGKNYTVRWNSTGISQDARISLNLLNRTAKTNVGSWITMVPQNIGVGDFVVSLNAEPGSSYEMLISVCSSVNGQDVCADARNPYSGVEDKSDNYFSIVAATAATMFKNIQVNNITPTSATFTWESDIPADSKVAYAKSGGTVFDAKESKLSEFVTQHSITIKDLIPNTSYSYDLTSYDKEGKLYGTNYLSSSGGVYFKTLKTDKPDLTITSIKFNSPNNLKGEDGTLSVTVKNLGSDLSETAGLLSWYNNFSTQNFIFGSSTPSILSFKNDKDVLTASKPLNTNESVTFSWSGAFNASGNIYLYFIVDNSNELDESNENNNSLSTVIQIKENSQDTTLSKDEQTTEIDYKAKLLNNDQLSAVLAELKELRNIVKEQAAKIKYFEKLSKDVEKLSAKMEEAINNFITYGVDSNTQKLGEGERAAVMYSYKNAFDKLPETEAELADAIKIANGRWPSITNDEAEKAAKEQFQKIYQRIADMNNANDNAAVTVMAYGLRQKAENRNLNSEKQGIKIFKNIYGHTPSTTEDWNIMQAITYSGSARGIDSDGDLLTDEREAQLGTDPKKKDTDGDGYMDGEEVANGHDPLKK